MSFRAVIAGVLPPRPGGASVSLGQIFAGLARAGAAICVVAPITTETMSGEGDWYAARNPELRVLRYWVPSYYAEPNKPMPADIAAAEDTHVPRIIRELAASFEPELLVAGVESIGHLVQPLAAELGLPWCQLLRGSPTAEILSGSYDADPTAFLERLRAADLVIAVARYMAEGLEREFGIAGIQTIPNAVDLAAFAPRPPPGDLASRLDLAPTAPMVLGPGRLLERKRPLDILRAAPRVLARRPETVFVLAGTGDQQAAIESFVRERGIERGVRLPGWITPDQMPALYHRAQVVVMASSEEGMSRVYLEAMASGCPLVASDIAPARELITHGMDGMLFPLGDHAALAGRIIELLADPPRQRALGRAARQAVADRGIDRAVADYGAVFARLAARGRKR